MRLGPMVFVTGLLHPRNGDGRDLREQRTVISLWAAVRAVLGKGEGARITAAWLSSHPSRSNHQIARRTAILVGMVCTNQQWGTQEGYLGSGVVSSGV